jgi:tetratricopeptide (TPR) repeat protein
LVTFALALVPAISLWNYAAVHPWTRYWVSIGILAPGVLALFIAMGRGRRLRPGAALLPLVALLIWGIGFTQTLPLGTTLTRFLSPGSASAYRDWVPAAIYDQAKSGETTQVAGSESENETRDTESPKQDSSLVEGSEAIGPEERFPTGEPGSLATSPITLSITHTREALTLPALFGLAMLAAMIAYRDKYSLTIFMGITAISGGMLAVGGLLELARQDSPYEMDPIFKTIGLTASPFGPFVNKNSAAGYLNLSIACTLGLLSIYRPKVNVQTFALQFEKGLLGWVERARTYVSTAITDLEAIPVALIVLLALQVVGLMAAGSRGGMLAFLIALVACVLQARKASAARLVGSVLFAAFAAVIIAAVSEQLEITERARNRFASITNAEDGSRIGRLLHWQDSFWAGLRYLPMGAGLGAHRYAYLPTAQQLSASWFHHAESMWLEWFTEGGVWLLPLIILGIVFFVSRLSRLAKHRDSALARGVLLASWFGLASLFISQSFDFGILTPPLYLTAAIFAGNAIGLSYSSLGHSSSNASANKSASEKSPSNQSLSSRSATRPSSTRSSSSRSSSGRSSSSRSSSSRSSSSRSSSSRSSSSSSRRRHRSSRGRSHGHSSTNRILGKSVSRIDDDLFSPRPEPGSRVPGSREPGSREPGSREPGSREPGSREPGSGEHDSDDLNINDPDVRETPSRPWDEDPAPSRAMLEDASQIDPRDDDPRDDDPHDNDHEDDDLESDMVDSQSDVGSIDPTYRAHEPGSAEDQSESSIDTDAAEAELSDDSADAGDGVDESSADKPGMSAGQRRLPFVVTAALFLGLIGASYLAIRWNHRAAISDYLVRILDVRPARISDPDFDRYFAEALPENPMLQVSVASAILRQQSRQGEQVVADRSRAPEGSEARILATIPGRRAFYYASGNAPSERQPVEAFLLRGQSVDQLREAHHLAASALTRCPLDYRPRLELIESSFVVPDDPKTAAGLAQQVASLWPGHADILDRTARLSYVYPGFEAAAPILAKFLELAPARFDSVWGMIEPLPLATGNQDASTQQRRLTGLNAAAAFPNDPVALVPIIESGKLTPQLEEQLIATAEELLRPGVSDTESPLREFLVGRLAKRTGDQAAAVEALREAVRIDPSNTAYRVTFAEMLAATGDVAAAREQLRRCLIQKPGDSQIINKLRGLER